MLPLCTERPAYDQSSYAAAAKLPSAHRHRGARGHSVVHGQRPIFPVTLQQPAPYRYLILLSKLWIISNRGSLASAVLPWAKRICPRMKSILCFPECCQHSRWSSGWILGYEERFWLVICFMNSFWLGSGVPCISHIQMSPCLPIEFYFLLLPHTSARVDFQPLFISKQRRETDWVLRMRWGWL